MSAEATNPATPGPVMPSPKLSASIEAAAPPANRRKGLPRIDLRRLGRAALLGPAARDRLPDAIGHVAEAHRAHHPERRSGTAAPGVRPRRVLAPRSDAQERRAVHHTPARRDPDPRRTRRGDHDVDGLPAPRHRRGHGSDPRSGAGGVRRGGPLSGRRRHQAGEGRLRGRRRARDVPQDARRHRQRRPRDVDQTRRPAAQHADPRRHAPREAGANRQGHQGRSDPAGRTARRPGAQDRARGPRLRDPAPRGVRAHQGADRRQRGARRRSARGRSPKRCARSCARRVCRPKSSSGHGTSSPCTGCRASAAPCAAPTSDGSWCS